jgi:hypothetical protein
MITAPKLGSLPSSARTGTTTFVGHDEGRAFCASMVGVVLASSLS